MANRGVGGWLRGTVVRKAGASTTTSTRANTPQVQSTSTTIFGGGVKDPSGRTAEYFSMDDQCPVCKSDRYLNPKLRLLVSSCYHKMCESCIDRLFTLGPAPCPICQKVLRKLAFMPQTFEDLGVEKEVAVRRRMAKEFNKRREDFDTLRDYNDYLQWVEDITFNLINEVDLAKTEAEIAAYRAENAALISLNIQREEQYVRALQEQEAQEREDREQRAQAIRKEEEEERNARDSERRALIDRLETSGEDAAAVVAKAKADAEKRRMAAAGSTLAQSSSRLLRTRAARSTAVPDVPHVALADDYYAYGDRYTVRASYNDPMSEAVRRDRDGIMRAGGYRVEEAWERALRCAVAGLDLMPLSGIPQSSSEAGRSLATDATGDVIMASV